MGTRTAIFQEQSDGTFIGIYCHLDGYINGVGKTLHEHYQDRNKIWELINAKKPLHSLGTTTENIDFESFSEVLNKNPEEAEKYSLTLNSPFNEEEYYIAQSVKDIQKEQYLTYDGDEVQGFEVEREDTKEFIPFRGSDNNGYLYYQDLYGHWYVSQLIRNTQAIVNVAGMGEFKALSSIL